MISFMTEYGEERLPGAFLEAIDFYRNCPEGAVFRFCPLSDALLIRGESEEGYFFPYPVFLDGADRDAAFSAIEEYALTQEIPLLYIDVPKAEAVSLSARYKDPDARAMDEDAEVFSVEVTTELTSVETVPTVSSERVSLTPLTDRDAFRYGRICRDRRLLRYWGYDYREDRLPATGRYFLREAGREFHVKSAMTFAVRYEGKLVGDATLYHFDGKGGAEFSLRVLPRFQHRGIGSAALSLLIGYVRDGMKLSRLRADVLPENLPSLSLMRKFLTERGTGEHGVHFEIGFE